MKVGAISEHSLGGVLKQVDFKEFLRILENEFGTEYRKLNPPSGGRFATRALPKLDPPQKQKNNWFRILLANSSDFLYQDRK